MGDETKKDRNHRTRRVDEENRLETHRLGEQTAKQGAESLAAVMDAVEPAEDSPSQILAGEINARHLPAQRPNAVPGSD